MFAIQFWKIIFIVIVKLNVLNLIIKNFNSNLQIWHLYVVKGWDVMIKSPLLFPFLFDVTDTFILQVSLQHLLQVFITLPSSITVEEATHIICVFSRIMSWRSLQLIIRQKATELIMEETLCSCSCSKETKCMWAWLQTHMLGETTTQLLVAFWSRKRKKK